ncbi:MAG: KGG domain-containing protein [Dialister pneumosintes]
MPKAENLNKKPNSQYLANIPPEKLKEIGRKGGKKSGESRRRKRAMRDLMADIMVISLEKGKTKQANQIKNLAQVQGLNVDT